MGTVVSFEKFREARMKPASELFDEDWEGIKYCFSPSEAQRIARDIKDDLAVLDTIRAYGLSMRQLQRSL